MIYLLYYSLVDHISNPNLILFKPKGCDETVIAKVEKDLELIYSPGFRKELRSLATNSAAKSFEEVHFSD
jgi:hypothetical protein